MSRQIEAEPSDQDEETKPKNRINEKKKAQRLEAKKLGQVVGEDDEGCLGLLCGRAHGPCFGFIEFVLQFIEALLDAPSHEVELRYHSGANVRSKVGQKFHDLSGLGDDKTDPPDHGPAAVAHHVVAEDPFVDRIALVVGIGIG